MTNRKNWLQEYFGDLCSPSTLLVFIIMQYTCPRDPHRHCSVVTGLQTTRETGMCHALQPANQ